MSEDYVTLPKNYVRLFRDLDNNMLKVLQTYEKSQKNEESKAKLDIASLYGTYEDSCHILEEILKSLKENKPHIMKTPEKYTYIIKTYRQNLHNFILYLGLITKDEKFISHVDPTKVKKMKENFMELRKETMKFFAGIGKDDESYLNFSDGPNKIGLNL